MDASNVLVKVELGDDDDEDADVKEEEKEEEDVADEGDISGG